ncbi:MAG: hypothetical protein IJZ85_07670 [Lachnospiraceae bacterium]|nr:hypothetical protein [Lachnospiraceae bacterium]
MKKIISLSLALILMLSVSGCAAKTSLANENEGAVVAKDLFENASPQTSALGFFHYNGETTTLQYLFSADSINKVLGELSSVPAIHTEEWSPEQITFPVYGINIMDINGYPLEAAWSNGYLVMQDGNVYRFDYDFAKLTDNYSFSPQGTWNSATMLPSAEHLFKDADGWHSVLMKEAGDLTPPEGITLEINDISENGLTVQIANKTDSDWTYGEDYSLQVNLDGKWYDIPTAAGVNWAFHSIAYLLPAGGKTEQTYSLAMYGALPGGNYRIIASGLTAEFELN